MINEPLILPYQQDNTYNTGIGSLGLTMPEPAPQMPSLGEIAKNVAKSKAIDYIGRKIGIEQLGSILGAQQAFGNPLGLAAFGPAGVGIGALQTFGRGLQNTTFGRSETIADYLAAKRAEKAAKKDYERDKQGEVTTYSIPTPQDTRRGGQYTGDGDNNNDGGGLNSGGRESYGGGGQYR